MARRKKTVPATADRLFLDTSFVLARFNRQDRYHAAARKLAQAATQCRELWTTDAILLELGAAFSQPGQRNLLIQLWDQLHADPRCRIVSATGSWLDRAMDLFRHRLDKAWSLTDCLSFVVMGEHRLTDALTCDQHFIQAGFRALLLEAPPD